jgi:4-hydroxy-2-oxoheptanedioate aldolase
MLTAIEHGGAEPVVRLQSNHGADAMKLLDLGAYGVIAPMIETAEDARHLADAIRYPPHGNRSFGPRRRPLRYGPDYAARAEETIVSMGMIETRRGLDNLDEILSVLGVAGVFIRPADLALGATPRPDSDDPRIVEAVQHIRIRCHATGRRAGIFCGGSAFAKAKFSEGFDLVSVAPDLPPLVGRLHIEFDQVRSARG